MQEFSSIILQWFEAHGRDLPWRQTKAPYPIWLSEVILQQTRIQQGTAYWERFLEAFPTVRLLAEASEDAVMRLWQGLGYYSRARNLHAAARQIQALGHFPDTYDEIRRLKGVGDYTAAAIASFAFDLPYAAVDGNVYRVLSRYFGIDTPINTTQGKRLFAELAQSLLPTDRAADFNQAMMDFGSLVCKPSGALCADCPLLETCTACREKRVEVLPAKERKLNIKERRLTYIYITHARATALHKRTGQDIWRGLWEPLCLENEPLPNFKGTYTLLRQGVKHVLTHRVLLADFYLLEASERPALPADYQWIPEDQLSRYAVPRLVELLFASVAAHS